jgi:hypothetical protein
MATIRWKLGRFGVTASFHVEFEKTAYRQIGYWPKTEVFSHSNEQVKNPLKSIGACASMARGFWPVPHVAHFPVNRCHTSSPHAPEQPTWTP